MKMTKILTIRISPGLTSRTLLVMPVLLLALAACAGRAPDPDAAQTAAQSPETLIRLAEGLTQSGNLTGARRFTDRALAADPGHVGANRMDARLLLLTGQPGEGRRRLAALFQANPENLMVREDYARALVLARLYAEALEVASPLLRSHSTTEQILFVARTAEVNRDIALSRRALDEALKQAPGRTDILAELALSFAIEGAYDTAIGLLEGPAERAGQSRPARRALGFVFALAGQPGNALDVAMSASAATDLPDLRAMFDILPELSREEQAAALFFDQWPERVVWRPGR